MADVDSTRRNALISRLRRQAERLDALERRIAELELERTILLDTSGRLNQELAMHKQVKEEWNWFFDNSLDLMCLASIDGYFKRINQTFIDTLGYSSEELISRPFIDFVHPDDISTTQAELQKLSEGIDCVSFENRYRDKSGNWHWLSWRCPAISSSISSLYAIARDITDFKKQEADILYLATHDVLTGLGNRAAFEQELVRAIARIERNAIGHIVLFMIDLDGFKEVNDTYGHAAGDELLRQIGARFVAMTRQSDLVCRLGGDEFVWLAEGLATIDVASFATRILTVCRQPIVIEGTSVSISCSIGSSIFPDLAHDAKTLLIQADKALYRVKKAGKSDHCRYE